MKKKKIDAGKDTKLVGLLELSKQFFCATFAFCSSLLMIVVEVSMGGAMTLRGELFCCPTVYITTLL